MRICNERWDNKVEDRGDLDTLARLVARVRRVRLAQLAHSDDPLVAVLALLTSRIDRLIVELQRLERRS